MNKDSSLGQLLETLPPDERAERYRQLANESLRRAGDASSPAKRAEYLSMAAGWHTLAIEIERAGNNRAQLEASQSRLQKIKPRECL